jgi:hypothetical protein
MLFRKMNIATKYSFKKKDVTFWKKNEFLIFKFVDIQLTNKWLISKNIEIWVQLKMWEYDIWPRYLNF